MIPVTEYLPDQAVYQNPGSPAVLNVIPKEKTYGPLPALADFSTNALSERAQGAWYGRASDGTGRVFVGTATKLYTLDGVTLRDVTRAAGAYSTTADGRWEFALFGTILIAVNGTDVPQMFDVDSVIDGTVKFVALGGTPGVQTHVMVVGDFVVFMTAMTVKWSAINNAELYTGSMADEQILPDGGLIRGGVGGQYGVIIQDRAIRRMDFGGPPEVFRFSVIFTEVGATAYGSIIGWGNAVFFLHRTGLYMLVNGAELLPIGEGKVNRTLWAEINQSNIHRVTAAVDPTNKLYVLSYPTPDAGVLGNPNKWLIYNWTAQRFASSEPGDHEMVYSAATQAGVDLDTDIDATDADLDAASLPSLDSEIYTGISRPVLGAFSADHELQYANGASLEATVDTAEQQIVPGQRAMVFAARPMIDGGTVTVKLGTRNLPGDTVTFGSAVSPHASTGLCNFRSNARYHRGRLIVAAAGTWTHIQGIDDIRAVGVGQR